MGLLGLMCYEDDQEENRVIHRYQTIPVQSPCNYETPAYISPITKCSNSNVASTNKKSLPKPQSPSSTSATTTSKAECSSPVSLNQKSLIQAKTVIPSFDYGKAIGIVPQSVKKPQVVVASPKGKDIVTLIPPAIPSLEPLPVNKFISESVTRETASDIRHSIPSSVDASLADTQSSIIQKVALVSKKKKNKSSLIESPQQLLKTLVQNPRVSVASPKSKDLAPLFPRVIQGKLCYRKKLIPSLEPSTINKSVSKPVSSETYKNEEDHVLSTSTVEEEKTSIPSFNDASLADTQISAQNVASASKKKKRKKKNKSLLTESPQSLEKTLVGVASPKSKDLAPPIPPVIQANLCNAQKPLSSLEPSSVNKSISKSVTKETCVNEQEKTAIPSFNNENANLADSKISIQNVASARKKKKTKSSLTESPQSLKNSQVGVTQTNLCNAQKPIPSLEPTSVNKSISKPVSRETYKNEQDPFPSPSTPASLPHSFKPSPLTPLETCSSVSSLNTPKKGKYVWVPKVTTPLYSVPEDFKDLIKRDIVPQVLRRCLTPAIYKTFFEALMYAEDYYCEKWSDYMLEDVKLELQKAAIYMKSRRGSNRTGNQKNKNMNENEMKEKVFVAFQIHSVLEKRDYVTLGDSEKEKEDESVHERRPFLLSRDYVNLRHSGKGKEVEPYQGVIYRVVRGNLVLAEFGDDFYLQHSPSRKYDVSFSFNRVCLKRSYQALSATTDTLLHNVLFPRQIPRVNMIDQPYFTPHLPNLNKKQSSAVYNILRLNSSPPFLVEGPLSVFFNRRKNIMERSATYFVIQEAVQQIYRSSPGSRILINAPRNVICDLLMTSLMVYIPESEIFRANAAFREQAEVDDDILPLCPFEGECFTCPSLKELQEFRVVLTTYMSSFRLHKEGISSGHFSHIFLVDASSVMEPEMVVSLSNLADEKTVVVVTGKDRNCSTWVRSSIGRGYGLKVSYFERLMEREPYCSLDPQFVARIRDEDDRTDAFPKKTWEGQY